MLKKAILNCKGNYVLFIIWLCLGIIFINFDVVTGGVITILWSIVFLIQGIYWTVRYYKMYEQWQEEDKLFFAEWGEIERLHLEEMEKIRNEVK